MESTLYCKECGGEIGLIVYRDDNKAYVSSGRIHQCSSLREQESHVFEVDCPDCREIAEKEIQGYIEEIESLETELGIEEDKNEDLANEIDTLTEEIDYLKQEIKQLDPNRTD